MSKTSISTRRQGVVVPFPDRSRDAFELARLAHPSSRAHDQAVAQLERSGR